MMSEEQKVLFKDNPFESGHIKNYILLYVSVVVIMVLFFIAATLFMENEEIEKKEFATQHTAVEKKAVIVTEQKSTATPKKFQLLEHGY